MIFGSALFLRVFLCGLKHSRHKNPENITILPYNLKTVYKTGNPYVRNYYPSICSSRYDAIPRSPFSE